MTVGFREFDQLLAVPRKSSPVKIVVVSLFGQDTGDRPGEFQTRVERLPLPEKIPFSRGYQDLRYNPEKGVLGVVTGVGTARAAASIMALGMDPRFDLGKAYWLVAGIAGVNPNEASIGCAAWAEWVVDVDLGFEIDAREMLAEAIQHRQGVRLGESRLRRMSPCAFLHNR